MKFKIVNFLIFTTSISTFYSQKKGVEYTKYLEIYRLSRRVNDNAVSKMACFELISIEGSLSSFKDSLAELYLNEKNYKASLELSEDLIKLKSSNFTLKINAYSLKGLGYNEESKSRFRTLLTTEKKKSLAYELAFLEFKTHNLNDALSTIDYAFAISIDDVKTVEFEDELVVYNLSLNDALNCLRLKIYIEQRDEKKSSETINLLGKNEILKSFVERIELNK